MNLASLRICFLAGTLGQGGAERQLFYILSALRQAGCHSYLLSLSQGEFWEGKIRALEIPVYWVGRHKSKPMRLFSIMNVARHLSLDVFQSQHFYTNLYVVATARMLGLHGIGAIRSNGRNDVKSTGYIAGYFSLHLPRAIAANSQSAINNAMMQGVSRKQLHFLPNVVDCEHFVTTSKPHSERIRLLAVGTLIELKRMDRFLNLLKHIKQQTIDHVSGCIAGDGPLRKKLEAQAFEMGLTPETLTFKGRVADTANLYQSSDILVLPSDWEGTPNVVLEAMASGLPVVANAVGGVPEIIQHGETGYLIQPGDDAAMADAVLALANDAGLRYTIGHRAREYVLEHHSLDRLPGFLEGLYQSVLG
jgi:glycosyltransferase involved in cell wall biosynthesis